MHKVFNLLTLLLAATLLNAMEEVHFVPYAKLQQASSIRQNITRLDQRIVEFIKTGDSTLLEEALLQGANINAVAEDGNSALHLAVETGVLQPVEILLAKGADIRLGNANGKTPLHIAAERGSLDIVKILLMRGADPVLINSTIR